MSDDRPAQPPDGPAPRSPRWWKPRRHPRRTLAIGAGVAALALAAGTTAVVLATGPDPGAPTSTATPLAHDPVPTARTITERPARCGVADTTVDALVPEHEPRRAKGADPCEWRVSYVKSDHGWRERRLEVFQIRAARNGTGAGTPDLLVSRAVKKFADAVARQDPDSMRPVTGLADEAVSSYDPDAYSGGGTVVFRFRNVVVKVTYSGADHKNNQPKSLSRKTALTGALKAATDIATRLGAPARPKITTLAAGPPAITRTIAPCDTVPEDTATELTRPTSTPTPSEENLRDPEPDEPRSCTWKSHGRTLTVAVRRFPDDLPGSGTRQAEHAYLRLYYSARATAPADGNDKRYFAALTGPGQQAFGAAAGKTAPGRVVFRHRNIIVDVTYTSTDEEDPLTRDEAVNGAYTAAAQVATALSE